MDEQEREAQYRVVWPQGQRTFADGEAVARIGDLSGKTIAAIWDYLFRGDQIFSIVTAKLAQRFPGLKVVPYDVFGNTHGSNQRQLLADVPEKLRRHEVDAVISLVGA